MFIKSPIKDARAPVHHSIADFDWGFTSGYRSLDPSWYKTAPTSLKIAGAVPYLAGAILCRNAGTQILPEGRIDTYFNRVMNAVPYFLFRNQSALGSAAITNTYACRFTSTSIEFGRYLASSWQLKGSVSNTFPNGTIERWRVDWWNGENLIGVPCISVALYIEIAGVWTLLGSVLYDTDNLWKTSGVNRAGLYYSGAGGNQLNIDDTEFWGP